MFHTLMSVGRKEPLVYLKILPLFLLLVTPVVPTDYINIQQSLKA